MKFAWVCWFGLAACEARATTTDPHAGAGSTARAELKSREYETCSASAACQEGLRCLDSTCRRAARSTPGDYLAAVGTTARGRGEDTAAVAAFAQAEAQYATDKIELPPEVDCEYGGALVAAATGSRALDETAKKHAELGARVLHRCVIAVPAGSMLRTRALADLALLGPLGLDPASIGSDKLADLYLTKEAAAPVAERVGIAAVASPVPAGRSFAQIPAAVSAGDLRPALLACWESHATKGELTVSLPLKSSYVTPEYDDQPGRYVLKLEPPAAPTAGETCVRAALEPALKALKYSDSFTTQLAITIR